MCASCYYSVSVTPGSVVLTLGWFLYVYSPRHSSISLTRSCSGGRGSYNIHVYTTTTTTPAVFDLFDGGVGLTVHGAEQDLRDVNQTAGFLLPRPQSVFSLVTQTRTQTTAFVEHVLEWRSGWDVSYKHVAGE